MTTLEMERLETERLDWVTPCEEREHFGLGFCGTVPTVAVLDGEGTAWKLCREHARERTGF